MTKSKPSNPARPTSSATTTSSSETPMAAKDHYQREKARRARHAQPDSEAMASANLTPSTPERDKRKLLLRKDLLKQSKRLARAQGRKLYQVVESALEEYIQRHGAPE